MPNNTRIPYFDFDCEVNAIGLHEQGQAIAK